jgi:hypothetical protein
VEDQLHVLQSGGVRKNVCWRREFPSRALWEAQKAVGMLLSILGSQIVDVPRPTLGNGDCYATAACLHVEGVFAP